MSQEWTKPAPRSRRRRIDSKTRTGL